MGKFLIASDLDGTLIFKNNDPIVELAVSEFNRALENKKSNRLLVYVTGRHLELALAGIKKAGLIKPDFLIADVGSSLYKRHARGFKIDSSYRAKLSADWQGYSAEDLAALLRVLPELQPQGSSKQGEFKRSYYIPLKTNLPALRKKILRLLPTGLKVKIISSVDRDQQVGLLDILPSSADKVNALLHLAASARIPKSRIVYAGDSGNDLSVFKSGLKSVIPKIAGPEVEKFLRSKAVKDLPVYHARQPFALGPLAGFRHFKALPELERGLYIQLHSLHGLFRVKKPELGADEDTGGQIIYVLELAAALSKIDAVEKVEIITRQIFDRRHPGYDRPFERINQKTRLVRLPCGPRRYLKKVKLWPHLDEFIDSVKDYAAKIGRLPDILHSNYADSGLICARLSRDLGIPQVHTGHSLGKPKMKRLGVTKDNFNRFNRQFHFKERLVAEQEAIDNAAAIIISSEQERDIQYHDYQLPKKDKFFLVEPSINLKKFRPYTETKDQPLFNIAHPAVMTLSRLDVRKNLIGLTQAFLNDPYLRHQATLVISSNSLANRNNLSEEEKNLLLEIEQEIKLHQAEKNVLLEPVPLLDTDNLYRLVARGGGVFVNPAFVEPFGLTLLEAGASGLPVVSTKYGGPVTIIKNCRHGLLVDPYDLKAMSRAIRRLLKDRRLWRRLSENGIKNVPRVYSWQAAAEKEVKLFKRVIKNFFSDY